MRRRRWKWLGLILRGEGENDCFTVLGWTSEGWRARGRQKKKLQKDGTERAKQSWMEEQHKLHKTESAGQTARRPYAPTDVTRDNDDNDDDIILSINATTK